MKNWFRTIELVNHDVLVVRNASDEDGEYVEVTAKFDEVIATIKLGFEDDVEAADKCFNTYNAGHAQEFVKNIASEFIDE